MDCTFTVFAYGLDHKTVSVQLHFVFAYNFRSRFVLAQKGTRRLCSRTIRGRSQGNVFLWRCLADRVPFIFSWIPMV